MSSGIGGGGIGGGSGHGYGYGSHIGPRARSYMSQQGLGPRSSSRDVAATAVFETSLTSGPDGVRELWHLVHTMPVVENEVAAAAAAVAAQQSNNSTLTTPTPTTSTQPTVANDRTDPQALRLTLAWHCPGMLSRRPSRMARGNMRIQYLTPSSASSMADSHEASGGRGGKICNDRRQSSIASSNNAIMIDGVVTASTTQHMTAATTQSTPTRSAWPARPARPAPGAVLPATATSKPVVVGAITGDAATSPATTATATATEFADANADTVVVMTPFRCHDNAVPARVRTRAAGAETSTGTGTRVNTPLTISVLEQWAEQGLLPTTVPRRTEYFEPQGWVVVDNEDVVTLATDDASMGGQGGGGGSSSSSSIASMNLPTSHTCTGVSGVDAAGSTVPLSQLQRTQRGAPDKSKMQKKNSILYALVSIRYCKEVLGTFHG